MYLLFILPGRKEAGWVQTPKGTREMASTSEAKSVVPMRIGMPVRGIRSRSTWQTSHFSYAKLDNGRGRADIIGVAELYREPATPAPSEAEEQGI